MKPVTDRLYAVLTALAVIVGLLLLVLALFCRLIGHLILGDKFYDIEGNEPEGSDWKQQATYSPLAGDSNGTGQRGPTKWDAEVW